MPTLNAVIRTRFLVLLMIVGILLAPGLEPAHAAEGSPSEETRVVSLEEAVALAFENSLTLKGALLDLEDAEAALAQAEAQNLVQPSPTSLIQAQRSLDIAKKQVVLTRFDVKLQVEEGYYGVLRAQNLLRIARESLDLAVRQHEIAQEKLESGAQTRADVLSAASHVADVEANVAQAEAGYELALLSFRRTLGVALDAPIVPKPIELEFQPVAVDLEADIAFALANRVEILQAQTGIDAAAKQVELSQNDYTPPLALRRAEIALKKAKNQAEQLRTGIELEIRQAHSNMKDAARRIPALSKGVEEAEENLRIARRLYEADSAPLTQVMGAQIAFSSARTDYVHAVFDYNLARARYDRAVARPLEEGETQ